MKNRIVAQSCLFMLALALADQLPASRLSENAEYDLELSIHCPKKDLKRGDEIPIVFTITNKGKATYSYDKRDYDRSGRMHEYKLVATGEDGTVVPDPRADYREGLGGGLSGGVGQIKTGELFTKTIALNRWALIKKAGRYSVTGTYYYYVRDPDAKQVEGVVRMKTVAVNSELIEIVIERRSRRQMSNYIRGLVIELRGIKPSKDWEVVEQREAILARLAYTCDLTIAPMLIDLMYKNYHTNEVFWAREAFLCYLPRDPETREKLVHAAKNRGLAAGMQGVLEAFDCSESDFKQIITVSLASDDLDILAEGVGAAQEHPDDDHMSKLIAVATDPNRPERDRPSYPIERYRAIVAIAHNRTDEGVAALKALLDDPDESIRRAASDAVRYAYRRHLVYPKHGDDDYTAKLVPIAMDCSDPRQTTLIVEIARTRTEEGVEAIKTLLEDPDSNVPLAEADEGVKAIRDLLRSPNKNVRDMTAGIIRVVYKRHPGRPLRRDDFGDEFRESFEEGKKRLLERLRRQSAQ